MPSTQIALRVAQTDDEREAWRSVRIAVEPNDRVASVRELRARDREDATRLYLIAELERSVAGCGFLGRSDLGHAALLVQVLAERRRRGVGTALLEALLEHAVASGYRRAGMQIDGADARSLGFAERHGFTEFDRQVEMVRVLGGELPEPPSFDGVEFVSIAERPELLARAHELGVEGYSDLKFATGSATISLQEWLRDEATLPGGSFVALAGDEIVGYAGLMAWTGDPTRAEHGLTVVRRAWRGRGLGTALKIRELAWASRNGIRECVTWTQRGNEALQGVNNRLGYTVRSISVSMRRELA